MCDGGKLIFFNMIINFIKFMRKNIFIAVAIICSVITGIIIGFGVSQINKIYIANDRSISQKEMDDKRADAFKNGWMAAKQKLIDSGYVNADKNSLSGIIKEIGENKIIFTAELVNPLDDESMKTRTALIAENTKIILRIQAEEEEVGLSALEENYNIWVASSENIADKSEFTAIRIIANKNNTPNDFSDSFNNEEEIMVPKIYVDDDAGEDADTCTCEGCSLDDNEIDETHSISVP